MKRTFCFTVENIHKTVDETALYKTESEEFCG